MKKLSETRYARHPGKAMQSNDLRTLEGLRLDVTRRRGEGRLAFREWWGRSLQGCSALGPK
eukprot:5462604-Alexandrium_andersonii.AAC.1